ncbi:hypothetical protein ColKHC_11739 [Colletotrichum higginsianum]|nr:hypothetical protein ColKHC_11739 [Colletotrichum higginsianum]
MSLIRLIIRTAPPTTQSIPSLRLFTLRPLLRKSLQPRQPCSPRRPFASAAPNPAPRTATSNPTGAGGSARTGNPRTGRTAFLAFWKITSVFSCAFFCLVAAPSYIRAEDKTLVQATGLAACGIIPLLFVAYTSAPFVTYIYLRLPPYARQSRALLERYVRTLPPTAQLEIGTMGLATRPRTTLVTAADLRPVTSGAAGGASQRVSASSRTSATSPRSRRSFGIREDIATSGGGSKSSGKGASYGVKDGWVWTIVRESLGKRK